MKPITDADVDTAVRLIEECQDVHELDATMREIMKAMPIFMEELRQKDPERFEKVARTFIAQAEAFKMKAKSRVQ
jgi:hypothetical protein